MTDDHSSIGHLRHLADIAVREEDRRHFAAAADELEDLYSHVDRLQDLLAGYEWLISDGAQEIGRLQGLINTWAATWIHRRDPERAADHQEAVDALLRAAVDHGTL